MRGFGLCLVTWTAKFGQRWSSIDRLSHSATLVCFLLSLRNAQKSVPAPGNHSAFTSFACSRSIVCHIRCCDQNFVISPACCTLSLSLPSVSPSAGGSWAFRAENERGGEGESARVITGGAGLSIRETGGLVAMAALRWESVQIKGPDSAGIATLTLNRPSRFNALNPALFQEIPAAIRALDLDPAIRVIIVNAAGPHFCSGIDLSHLTATVGSNVSSCMGRQREKCRREVKEMQDAFNAFEECRKPVIAAVHGACIGGGIDMITACDLRYCTQDAIFCVKEVDVAITADLGTLQRLPKLIGHGNAMELALTARRFSGPEARSLGLVQGVLLSKDELDAHVHNIAQQIAEKSPLAVTGTKTVLIKSRDLTVAQGLEYVGLWNAAMLASEDLQEALQAQVVREVVKEKTPVPIRAESEEIAAGASSEVKKNLKRQIFEVGEGDVPVDVPIEVQFCAEEAPRTLPKRKVGRPKKAVKEKVEESDAGRNWPDSEVFALIDIRGEMEPDFVKNAKKQGVDSWSNLHVRMTASVEGFSRTPIACKRKFNSLYKQYKDDKMANNVSDSDRNECKFYECLDHWWHFNGHVMKHVSSLSKNCTTPTMDNLVDDNGNQSAIGDEVNKPRTNEIQST